MFSRTQTIGGRLDVTAVGIIRIARQAAPRFDGIGPAHQDGNAVPAFLAMPNRAIAGVADRPFRKLVLRRLQFLQAHDVGRGLVEPAQEYGEPAVDSIDIEGGELHGGSIYTSLISLSSPLSRPRVRPRGQGRSTGAKQWQLIVGVERRAIEVRYSDAEQPHTLAGRQQRADEFNAFPAEQIAVLDCRRETAAAGDLVEVGELDLHERIGSEPNVRTGDGSRDFLRELGAFGIG